MLIHGITVSLINLTQSGTDAFGAPVYTEASVSVDNVLVSPSSEEEILDTVNLYGKRAVYTLCIPKGDSHDWENTFVEFFGERWRTIGKPLEYIDDLVPLSWNKKVRVENVQT